MASQLYTGIVNILRLHPNLKTSPVYIAGESYAGKYIPAIAHYIYKQHDSGGTAVNLAAIMIGNGETKPYTSYASTPDYLFQRGYIDETQQEWAHEQLKVCKQQVLDKDYIAAFETCQKVEDDLFAKFVKVRRSEYGECSDLQVDLMARSPRDVTLYNTLTRASIIAASLHL